MHAITFTGRNYENLSQEWWEHYHGSPLFPDLLSDDGIVVLDKTGPVLISYSFLTINSNMYLMGWIVGKPGTDKEKLDVALQLLFKAAEDESKRLGYAILYVHTESGRVKKACDALGYFKGDVAQIYLKETL